MNQKTEENPLIVALDVASQVEAARICNLLRGRVKIFKVGLQLFISEGRGVVDVIHSLGGEVFLDLKLYDIPHQVTGACEEIVKMGVKMFTIHLSGGRQMIERAVQAVKKAGPARPLILGATVLTSLDQESLAEMGITRNLTEQVVYLAQMAEKAGLDGVVSSPWEIAPLRSACRKDFLIVTPGVRPQGKSSEDQRRVMTPAQAIKAGASYIVVGRPILQAADPRAAVDEILKEIGYI